jgi:rhodanese-related sulfurtransferase
MALGVFWLLASLTAPVFASEDKPDTPTTLEGGKIINAVEAKALVDKKGAYFFDMRSAINFGKGHIPGATALPYKENSEYKAKFDASKDVFELSKLPTDKNASIVFYSDGPSGWKSYKAAVLSKKAGYKKVLWLREGTKGWEAKKFPLE